MRLLLILVVLSSNISFGQNSKAILAMAKHLNKVKQFEISNNFDSIYYHLHHIIENDRLLHISYDQKKERLKRDSILRESLDVLNSMLEIQTNTTSLRFRAVFYTKTKDFKSAIKDFEKIMEIDSTNFISCFNLGKLYERTEEFYKSLDYYSKAIQLKKDYSTLYLNRGFIYLKLEKYDLAIIDFKQSLVKPENSILETQVTHRFSKSKVESLTL